MHETALARSLLNQVEQLRIQEGAERITIIRLAAGEFSGIEPYLLIEAFRQLSAGTNLEDARLELEVVGLQAACDSCGDLFAVEQFVFECPKCHSRTVTVVRGEDLRLESITLGETEADSQS